MASSSLFRVDKFEVPAASRDAFIERLKASHAALDHVPGCRQNLVLEKASGPGRYNVVTFVEWENEAAYEAARAAAMARQEAAGFDRLAFFQQLKVSADLANYVCFDFRL
jgi:heme-degrading monooxygenase HmoA